MTYSGLYRLVADWQVELIGKYSPLLAHVLAWLVLAGPAGAIVRRRIRADTTPGMVEDAAKPDRRKSPLTSFVLAFVFATAGFVSVLISEGVGNQAMQKGPTPTLDVAAFGRTAPPEGLVKLTGVPDLERNASMEEEGPDEVTATAYVPIVPAAEGGAPDRSQPIRFFVERDVSYRRSGPPVELSVSQEEQGFLVRNGLPAETKALFEKEEIRVAEPHYVLVSSLSRFQTPYLVFAVICAGLAVLFVVRGFLRLSDALSLTARRGAGA